MLDGVEYHQEHFVVALGIDKTGAKSILGFHQGASENQQIGDQLLADLVGRGLDLKPNVLVVIDGSRALRASVKKHGGEAALVQRCQIHKRRNVCEHFADDQQDGWDRKLATAYDLVSYAEAKKTLGQTPRTDARQSQCRPQSGRRTGRNPHRAPPGGARGVASLPPHYQPHRVCLLQGPNGVSECEALAPRRPAGALDRFRSAVRRAEVPAHCGLQGDSQAPCHLGCPERDIQIGGSGRVR